MAKCEKREIKPVAPTVEYVLTLTEDEAKAVCLALGHFGGGGYDPTEAPFHALVEALGGTADYTRAYEIVQEEGCVPYIRKRAA